MTIKNNVAVAIVNSAEIVEDELIFSLDLLPEISKPENRSFLNFLASIGTFNSNKIRPEKINFRYEINS